MPNHQHNTERGTKLKPREPEMYNVVMHNDDMTTMDFVVGVLISVFFKPTAEAIELMMTIHESGSAVVGQYYYDIAQSKAQKAQRIARDNGFPLRVTVEPIDINDLPF